MAPVLDARDALPLVSSDRPRVRTACSLDEVDRLEPAWSELDRHVDYPLAHFAWVRAAMSVCPEACPHVVASMRGSTVEAVAPLVKKRLGGVQRLFLAGVGELLEPLDLTWSNEQALERVVSALAWSGTPLFLERVPAKSLSLRKLKRRLWGRAVLMTRPAPAYPYIALGEKWLSPEQQLNAGRRSDLRRARRKAEQLGEVTTEIHTPDLFDLSTLLDTAFEVEARCWKGEAGTALAHDSVRAVFYRQYAQAACTAGMLRICFLRIGDRVAAMQLAIEHGDAFWLLKVGYDARFSRCSPGLLLMRDTIRYAVEAGLARYELLGGSEEWTKVWTSAEHPCISLRVYPLGVRGASALVADGAAAALRKWRANR